MECRRVKHQGAKSFNSGNLRQTLTFSSAVCRTGTMQSSHCWRYPASYLSRDFAVQWGILCIRISLGCCQGDKKCASQEMLRWATKEIIWKSKPLTVRQDEGVEAWEELRQFASDFNASIPPATPAELFIFSMKIYLMIIFSHKKFLYHFLSCDPTPSHTHAHIQCGDSPCDHADLPKEKVTRVSIIIRRAFSETNIRCISMTLFSVFIEKNHSVMTVNEKIWF